LPVAFKAGTPGPLFVDICPEEQGALLRHGVWRNACEFRAKAREEIIDGVRKF